MTQQVLPADPLAAYQLGIAQERERCAKIADVWAKYYGASEAGEVCAIIRGEIERGRDESESQ